MLSDLIINKDKLFHIKDQEKFTQAALVECWRHEERRFLANWAPCSFADKLGPALFGAQFAPGKLAPGKFVLGKLGPCIIYIFVYWIYTSKNWGIYVPQKTAKM